MKIERFFNEAFGNLTVVADAKSGESWFIAGEVAGALGYKNISDAILKHTAAEDRKTLDFKDYRETRLSGLWGENDFRPKTLINESGVYCLVFGSKLDSAVGFKRWVTKDVLPSIRKNGGYISGQEDLNSEERKALEEEIRSLTLKVAYLQKRRHAIRKEMLKCQDGKRQLKHRFKVERREKEILREDLLEQIDLYVKLSGENARMANIVRSLTRPKADETAVAKNKAACTSTVVVDASGFVIRSAYQ